MEKGSTQPLKERAVEDKEETVETELKVMELMMKVKEKVKEGREEDDSIGDSSDDEAHEHDPVQLVVVVKEVPTVKPVETMALRTVVKGRIDLDALTDLLDSVVKEAVCVMVNSVGKEEAVEAVDEVVTGDHEEEAAKKVAKGKGRNR